MISQSGSKNASVSPPSNRSFGLTFSAVFAVIGVFPAFSGGQMRLWSWVLAGAFLVLALYAPDRLSGANRIWSRLGIILHKVTSPLALAIVFLLAFVFIGLIMRLVGKQPLKLRAPSVNTYWNRRSTDDSDVRSMRNQF